MNAYELANDLENSNGLQYITKVGLVSLSAQMLRQQADRIAELEKEVKELTFKQESLCKIIRMRLNDVPRSQHPSS
jgi:hypothetical protein